MHCESERVFVQKAIGPELSVHGTIQSTSMRKYDKRLPNVHYVAGISRRNQQLGRARLEILSDTHGYSYSHPTKAGESNKIASWVQRLIFPQSRFQ